LNWKRLKQALFSKAQVITGVTLTFLISSALVRAYQEFSFTDFSSGTPISAADMNNKINLLNKRLAAVGTVTSIGITTSLNVSAFTSNVLLNFNTVFYDYSGGLGNSYVSVGNMVTFTSSTQGLYEYVFVSALTGSTGITYVTLKKNSSYMDQTAVAGGSIGHVVGRHYFKSGDFLGLDLMNNSSISVTIDPNVTKLTLKKL